MTDRVVGVLADLGPGPVVLVGFGKNESLVLFLSLLMVDGWIRQAYGGLSSWIRPSSVRERRVSSY